MAYMLPLRFIKVSGKRSDNQLADVSICATRIVALMSTDNYQARKTITDERRNGTLINAAGRMKVKTAIFLDNGSVIASPMSVRRLMTMIDKSEDRAKQISGNGRSMRIYEVRSAEPIDTDEESDIASALYESDEDEDEEYDV